MDPAQINNWISKMENKLSRLVAFSIAVTSESPQVMADVRCNKATMQAKFHALEMGSSFQGTDASMTSSGASQAEAV